LSVLLIAWGSAGGTASPCECLRLGRQRAAVCLASRMSQLEWCRWAAVLCVDVLGSGPSTRHQDQDRVRCVNSGSTRRYWSFSRPPQGAGAQSSVDRHGFLSQDNEWIRPVWAFDGAFSFDATRWSLFASFV